MGKFINARNVATNLELPMVWANIGIKVNMNHIFSKLVPNFC